MSFTGRIDLRSLPKTMAALRLQLDEVFSPNAWCRLDDSTAIEALGTEHLAAELAGLRTSLEGLKIDVRSVELNPGALERLEIPSELERKSVVVGSLVGEAHLAQTGSTQSRRFTATVVMAEGQLGAVVVELGARSRPSSS
jgi:hypothetical protein